MYGDIQKWRQESAKDAQTHPNVYVGHLLASRPKQIPAANWRKTCHDQCVKDAPLREGQLVYLKEVGLRGRHEIQGVWS